MRWTPSNWITGVQSLLTALPSENQERDAAAQESIRQAMLDCLGEPAVAAHPVVALRVAHANDLQDLWYLRGDLMGALASQHGEAVARRKLGQISDMFKGHVPKGLASRPSPLDS
jgi:hypothetical protein